MRFSGIFVIIVAMFVAVLVTSNIIAVKSITLLPIEWFGNPAMILPASIIIFPISYIIGNLLTEVYGFHAARGVIWLGFIANAFVVLALWIAGLLPASPFWDDYAQSAYGRILGQLPFILIGSFFAYLTGELANSTVLALMKYKTRGRFLWMRTIGSTIVGQGLDSVIFIAIAFGLGTRLDGIDGNEWSSTAVIGAILAQWITKILYEVAATPLTYAIVGYMKRKERMDVINLPRTLNPFGVFAAGAQPQQG